MNPLRRGLWVLGIPARAAFAAFIRAYQLALSGAFGGQCRFYPSCSDYGLQAVRMHGAAKGSLLAAWRLLRCAPWTKGGIDHVPPRGSAGERANMYERIILGDDSVPRPMEATR